MSGGECCETDTSNESKSIEAKDDKFTESTHHSQQDQHLRDDDDDKLHEMGEALEIAENRCNTLKEQLDQMRNIYRERSTVEEANLKEVPLDANVRAKEIKQALKQPIMRQNSEAISTDNSGAAVLTINNILNGITNSINRLSELHTYIEPETPRYHNRKKLKRSKPHENEFENDNRNAKCSASRSSSWIFNEKGDSKKRAKRVKSIPESGSMAHLKKPALRVKIATTKEEPSTTSVRNRKKHKRVAKPIKRPSKRPGFGSNASSNHLVEIYHNSALDFADSEELIQAEYGHESRNHLRANHADLRSKYSRKEVQLPTISTTDCKEQGDAYGATRTEGFRSLSPIKEQEPNMDVMQQQEIQYPAQYFFNRGYQSPTISSKMKQVTRSYFKNFSCKSIPFCAAKSTSPSHNIGINIQQVMSIIKGSQNVHGISPTLAHNIGLAAERLNDQSFSALVSSFGSRYNCSQPVPCPMQCNVNYQQLQEMATEVPNDENFEEEAENGYTKNKIEIEITNRKSQEALCWSIDPNTHNNCTCATGTGISFHQIVDKYQNCAPPPQNTIPTSIYSLQQNMYIPKIHKKPNKRYGHIRSVYAQYNDRKNKTENLNDYYSAGGESNLPLHGKEKVLKSVLINLHDEFGTLSDKFDELTKIVEDENRSNPDNVEKLEVLEKKLNEKEMETQMVMALYTEVLNLKAQVRALREKAGMSAAIVDSQLQRMKTYQRYQSQPIQGLQPNYINNTQGIPQIHPQFYAAKTKESKNIAALHLTKLLRQIHAYREVCKTGGK
ncbi:uncharacterized protein [Atheta coriaria]|uniref:uncharacterized protein isoform X1 n=1 Tax=Dalotia coriaria TaxID=877792 RepID=UPI0031F37CE0